MAGDTPNNPMKALRALAQRIKHEAGGIGLELFHLAVVPGPTESDPDLIQAVFIIRPDAVEPEVDEAQAGYDKTFEDMMKAEKAEADKAKMAEAADEVRGWLEEGK